mmetsp:Transcript_22069/g.46008  ORF Transcript_22069/g.46008 Transcript_22069/m.46008 type:complete len:204 (+) Transcript_22069:1361-1972(+)
MDRRGGIAKHFFVDSQVDSITNGNFASLGLLSQTLHMSLEVGHLLFRDGAFVNIVGEGGSHLCVVVSIRGIRILKFLGQLDRGHRRLVSEFDSSLDIGHDFFLGLFELIFCENSIAGVHVFKFFDRILFRTGPGLFFLATTLVLRVSWRMSIETVGVDLKDGGALSLSNVINDGLSSLGHINGVQTVNQKSWNTVVLSLVVHF